MGCRLLLAITALLFCILGPAPAAAREVLLLADQWCPYNCDPSSDHPGYGVEILREALQASGSTLVYRTVNWTRAVEEVRVGHADAVIGMTMDEVRGFVFPKEPIGMSALGFIARSDSDFHYAGPFSLENRVVGMAAGYVFGGPAGDYIRHYQADRARVQVIAGDDALALNLRKLTAGRIDLVVDDANVLAHLLNSIGPGTGLKLAAAVDATPVYVAFSPVLPDAHALCALLDAGIRRMRGSGRLAQILARYDVRDWE